MTFLEILQNAVLNGNRKLVQCPAIQSVFVNIHN